MEMWTVFVDDSELAQRQVARTGLQHLVALAAVMFSADGARRYQQAVTELRAELGVPVDCELKWSPPRGSWLKTPDGNAARTALRIGMIDAAIAAGGRSVTVVYERTDAQPADVVRARTLRYLYDKVALGLGNVGDYGMIITDEPGGGPGDQRTWLASTRTLTRYGTAHTAPDRIALPIVACPSEHMDHIQLADLIAGATTAAVAGKAHALGLMPQLCRLADRNRSGRIGGAGLTIWPPHLVDLYFWPCNETVYARTGRMLRLGPAAPPVPDRIFRTSAGI